MERRGDGEEQENFFKGEELNGVLSEKKELISDIFRKGCKIPHARSWPAALAESRNLS